MVKQLFYGQAGVSWGELGCTGADVGVDSEWGVLQDTDSIAHVAVEVQDTGVGEMAPLWGVWGIPGDWDVLRGSSGVFPGAFRHSRDMVHGSEWGRAWNFGIIDKKVDNDMASIGVGVAVAVGSRGMMGDWGVRGGGQDGVWRLLDRH
jgi:hypothetical protein